MGAPRYVQAPNLRITHAGDRLTIENVVHFTALSLHSAITEVLAVFTEPAPLAAVHEAFDGFSDDVLAELVDALILIDERDLELFRYGSLRAAKQPVGAPATLRSIRRDARADTFVVLGAPVDLAAAYRAGARLGPDELRAHVGEIVRPAAELMDLDRRRLYDVGALGVRDLGDVYYQRGESLDAFGARLARMSGEIVRAGMTPVVIGGDHSITPFAIAPHLEAHAALGMIHFDGQTRFYDPRPHQPGVHNFNALGRVLAQPSLRRLHAVGLRRAGFQLMPADRFVDDDRVTYVSAREAQRLSPVAVFEGVPADLPYYLSISADCLEHDAFPGGLTYYQASELLAHVMATFRIAGVEVVEHRPGTGRPLAHLLGEILLSRAPSRALPAIVLAPQ
ncbi:MAG TPA: arginase family protein [Kofleriaceae bacterium]|nr:arginase family protein [Kofleriaceae bacterium]